MFFYKWVLHPSFFNLLPSVSLHMFANLRKCLLDCATKLEGSVTYKMLNLDRMQAHSYVMVYTCKKSN